MRGDLPADLVENSSQSPDAGGGCRFLGFQAKSLVPRGPRQREVIASTTNPYLIILLHARGSTLHALH